MIRGGRRLALGLSVLAAFPLALGTSRAHAREAHPSANGVRFVHQPKRHRLRLVTPRYDLSLSDRNGAILSLVERDTKTSLVIGQGGCQWAARADGSTDYIGGCSFTKTGTNRFSYAWDASTSTLTLRYDADPNARPSASAVVQLEAQPTSVDLRLTVTNHWQRNLWSVVFPADLYGSSAAVSAGYAPNFLPGVQLGPGFFTGTRGNVLTYPGRWGFADYLGLDFTKGHLALYSANPPPNPIAPVELGFVRAPAPGACSGRVFCITHSFDTWVADGTTWTSPTVRIRVGDTVDTTLAGYRQDNAIDKYPSVADKLGAKLDTYERAPLIKADAHKGLPPLSLWASELRRLPSPALLHPVRFQPGAFDARDPDFLPPDPQVGSEDEFRSMIAAAHSLGLLVMPYLNFSWWNVDSPTVRQELAGVDPRTYAALTSAGQPITEPYHTYTGYVVSPYAPAVRTRLAELMNQWQNDVPSDCYFFDQIGARAWTRDFNPTAPTPLAYGDGWVSLMGTYANRCLMVEDGWDRLAQPFAAFHGGLLVVQRETQDADYLYGAGNWRPFPLAVYLLHDKVLFYQHDLSEQTMTRDPETLMWNMAFGYMLTYTWELAPDDDTLSSPWLDVVGSYQHALGPYYAGQPLQSYTYLTPRVTQSGFPSYSVVANWSATDTYTTNSYGVAPNGFLARSADGAVVAGAFKGTFDGFALSPGMHDLIVRNTASAIEVHQPLGSDTQLAVKVPTAWAEARSVRAIEVGPDGQTIGPVAGQIVSSHFVFDCAGPSGSGFAPTYRLTAG